MTDSDFPQANRPKQAPEQARESTNETAQPQSGLQIFQKTVPVLMGYIPLGATFGLLFTEANLHWGYALLMSLIVFAGSGQFLLVALLAAQAGLVEIAVSSFLLNLRHVFYGLAMRSSMKGLGWRRFYMIFGLTDETFALLKTTHSRNEREFFWITLLNHTYWIIGSVLGAAAGNLLDFSLQGIEFSLTALFVVLSIDLIRGSSSKRPLLIGLVAGSVGLTLFPKDQMLVLSLLLVMLVMILENRWQEKR